jgi:hypothetical protein
MIKKKASVKKESVNIQKLLRQLESLSVKDLGLPLVTIVGRINSLKGYEAIQISVKRPKTLAVKKKTSKK